MPANYVLLERIELNASAASITFSNIPQSGYTDLKIVCSARSNRSSQGDYILLAFNGSTTSYSAKIIEGYGSGVSGDTTARCAGIMNSATSTSNTFGNNEIYIPNYTSSNYKSYSADGVSENNSTVAYQDLVAGLWSNTAAITSVALSPNAGTSFDQYSTFSLYGLAAVGTTPVIAPKASGGNITTDGTYWYHTFLSTGAFVPSQSLSCDYLVIAGGGGGTQYNNGGAGAGGLRSTVTATGGGGSLESAISVASGTSYTITVGAGGAFISGTTAVGASGTNSTFSSITSTGGAGSMTGTANGASGGSGGGAATDSTWTSGTYTGGAGTSGQGYAGGSATQDRGGAGGGGAGAVGGNKTLTRDGGAGGAGLQLTSWATPTNTGASNYYAGGGGGGSYYATIYAGGSGGGGNGGGAVPSKTSTSGTINTGGGAGGAWDNGATVTNGGSGIVIIRYAMA